MKTVQAIFIAVCLGLLWYSGLRYGRETAPRCATVASVNSCPSCHIMAPIVPPLNVGVVRLARK